ncbi:MAG: hypothetical protein JXK07_00460 [Spirochaetes bacterium]|nr:hypothetical protein [Spirochaetota bacterium]MBN2771504.1 hypothetical protein [Spirochaetota bacterium]
MKRFLILFFLITIFASSALYSSDTSVSRDYSRALHLITEKKYKEALVLLTDLEGDDGVSKHHVLYQRALCHYYLGESDLAIDYSKKSIKEKRNFEKPYLLLFDLYNEKNNFDESTYYLHTLVESVPQQYEHYFTLGIMYGKYIKNNELSKYCFEKVIKISKKMPVPSNYLENSYLYLSSIYFEEEQNEKAVNALNMAVKYNPDHNSRFYNVANYYISKNMLHEAVLSIRFFTDNLTDEQRKEAFIYKVYAFLGRMYYLQDKKEAMLYLRLGAMDSSFDGQICRALFEHLAGNTEKAEKLLLEIVKKNNGYISPYYALARIMDKKGKKAEAHDYYITTALMLYNSGLTMSAKTSLLGAISIKPDQPKTHELLARLYESEKKYASALYHYKKSDPNDEDIEKLIHTSFLYFYINDYKGALKTIDKAMAVDAKNDRVLFISGIVNHDVNNYKKSIEHFERALQIDESKAEYYYYMAMSQEKLELYDESVASLKIAINLDKNNPDYYNFLGYLYAERNTNLDESYKLLSEALRLRPFNGAYLDSMGWLYYQKGEYELAERYLVRAYRNLMAIGQRDTVVYDHLGDTYEKMGNKRMAVKFWKRALSLDKTNEKIKQKINNK